MKQHLPRLIPVFLVVGASVASAQTDLNYIFTARPKYTFSASVKIKTGGAAVKFGNLGEVIGRSLPNADGVYVYENGSVSPDSATARADEATGEFYANGRRYRTYSKKPDGGTPVLTGDNLAYLPGYTRNWEVNSADQIVGQEVTFRAITGTTSDKEAGSGEGGSSAGFDISVNRELGTLGKNVQWGIAFSLGLADINAKTSKVISATLLTRYDKYILSGTLPAGVLGGPSYGPLKDANGLVIAGTYETTVPISNAPLKNSSGDYDVQSTPGGAKIKGTWQVKGGYYSARLGPSFRYQVAKRFSIFGNAGLGVAYIGSNYKVDEEMIEPVLTLQPSAVGEIHKKDTMIGFYGELNAEFWITYRTGLFVGVVYEHLGDYVQTAGHRTASVEIGSGTSFKIGVINRF
jgi:hypothetical protein